MKTPNFMCKIMLRHTHVHYVYEHVYLLGSSLGQGVGLGGRAVCTLYREVKKQNKNEVG